MLEERFANLLARGDRGLANLLALVDAFISDLLAICDDGLAGGRDLAEDVLGLIPNHSSDLGSHVRADFGDESDTFVSKVPRFS